MTLPPLTIKQTFLTRAAAKIGISIIPTWRLEDLPMAEHLRRIFDHHQVDLAIDVGANRGVYRDLLRHNLGFKGKIVSFEPIPSLAHDLRMRAAGDSNWIIVEAALAEITGPKKFNVMKTDVFSSFLEPDHSHTSRFSGNTVSEQLTINAFRLDDFAATSAELATAKHVFLKLDTQGYDVQVLAGGVKFLQRVVAFQTEISFVPIYAGMPSFSDALAFAGRFGFAPSMFFPVCFKPDLAAVEMDCICVRKVEG